MVRANEAVLTYMHSHAIARTWGSPYDCAADAMSLDMPGIRIPEKLKDVVLPDISLKTIEKGWAGHIEVADAVMSGRLSATAAIGMQGAARHGGASFRAGHAHGLLLRTNDLLRSYTDPHWCIWIW